MTRTDAERIAGGMAYIRTNWPRIAQFIPTNAIPRLESYAFHLRTHSIDVLDWWLTPRGGKHFIMTASPPPEFFWLALRGKSCSLLAMWNRDGRKFWFDDGDAPPTRFGQPRRTSGQLLDAALERWETSLEDVAFSGYWGWCDPLTGRFDHDDDFRGRKEEWED